MVGFVGDPLVIFSLSALFILGGLGFTVIGDVTHKLSGERKHLQLHTKIMLVATPTLLIVGTLMFWLLERNNIATLGALSAGDQWLAAFFQSATARTAGFNSIDLAQMSSASLLFMILLMLIGAGSTSTGGGIKVSTFVVAAAATYSFLCQKNHIVLFRRTIGNQTVTKALAIIVVSGLILFVAMFALMITEKAPFNVIVFETISAFATVGVSAGLTAELSEPGKLIMVVVMVIGRIGPLTLAYMLARPEKSLIRHPEEPVFTG
ncbi:potassium uptake protein [Vibrio ishigakensis]|uniref:Potassium uptake protein n=1 Tax=Vibrio ishigakensis TaxID=1481914 RepID=A0A0B8Q7K7_9VIBR|nr:potassium uptake protein [Vibrio ishigakensis]